MADDLRGRLEILKEIKKAEADINAAKQSTVKTQLEINKFVDEQKAKVVELGRELKQANLERLKGFATEESSLKSMGSIYDDLVNKDRERLIAQVKANNLTAPQEAAMSKIASINKDLAQLGRDDVLQKAALTAEYDKHIGELGSISSENQHIVDNLTQQNDLANTQNKLTTKQKDFLQKQRNVYDGIKDTIGGILETASLLTSTIGGVLGGALIGAGYAGKKLLHTAQELGGSLLSTSNISTTLFGTVFKDAVGTTKNLSKEFGGLNDVSLKTQLNTNVMAENMGISTVEAAGLYGQFSRLNDGSTAVAENLIQSSKELAIQNGLVPADVMADLAGSTEEFALFGKDGGKNIAEAAIAAGKLGVNMKTLSGVADNLLDFESSINAELELGAMLGKNINLDRARALAYEGDIGGMVRETLSSLGGIEEFNKMDYFSKKKTAELLGVSVAEFEKMATNADKLNKDGSIQLSTYDQTLETLKAFGSPILTGVQSLGSMAVAAGQMGFNLKDGLTSMKGMTGIGGKLKGFLGGMFGKGKDMVKSKGGTKSLDSGKSLSSKTNPASKGGMMDSIGKIDMKKVLQGAAAMVIVAGAVFIFGKAVQEFMKVSWEAVGMAVVSMLALVGAVALLGAIMMSGVGAVAILAGAAAMLVVASAVLVLGIGLQAIGTGFEMLGAGISSLTPNLLAVGTSILGMVTLLPMIGLLSLGLIALAGSLAYLALFGTAALPVLMGIGVAMMMAGLGVTMLGNGLSLVGTGLKTISDSASGIGDTISGVGTVIGNIVTFIGPIMALSLALTALAASLMLVSVAGITALPGLLAIGAIGAIAVGINGLFGGDESDKTVTSQNGESTEGSLLAEIKGLREDLISGKVGVYMDGAKVTAAISKVVDKVGSNSYAI
jgi:hypothetical protein